MASAFSNPRCRRQFDEFNYGPCVAVMAAQQICLGRPYLLHVCTQLIGPFLQICREMDASDSKQCDKALKYYN